MTKKPAINSRVVIADDVATANRRGVVYIVTKHLTTNVEIRPENPASPAGGRINPLHLRPAPTTPGDAPTAPTATTTVVPYLPPLHHATVATVDGPTWKQPREWLWVVLGQSTSRRGDKYRIARLGGASGTGYWRVPRSWITPIDPERITVTDA